MFLFLILNILIYTSLVYLPLYYWLEPHQQFFFLFLSFVCWKDFLYSVHEYSDIIYNLEKAHVHLGKCVCFFKSKRTKETKETRLENTSRLYKDSAVLD